MMNHKTKPRNKGVESAAQHCLQSFASTALGDAAIPDEILIAPWGAVESDNGSFLLDAQSAESIQQAFADHGTDLPIDYEHQTLGGTYASPNGQAPAAGWIKTLRAQPEVGLMAAIEWTQRGREAVASMEYRYLSPVAVVRKSDRRMIALHSVALTNKPAITGMEPIVARQSAPASMHGPAGAAGAEFSALRQRLQLDESASDAEVIIAAGRRLRDLETEARLQAASSRIDEAVQKGRVSESQRGWAERLALASEALFDEWLSTCPQIVPLGASKPPVTAAGAEKSTAARARAEYRSNPLLQSLTSEEAFVTDAKRQSHAAP